MVEKKKNRIPLSLSSMFVVSHTSIQLKKDKKNQKLSRAAQRLLLENTKALFMVKILSWFIVFSVLLRLPQIGGKVEKRTVAGTNRTP